MLLTVRDVTKYIGSVIADSPVCIETGCTYVTTPSDLMHTTTNNILENICDTKSGVLFSFDIDQEHINAASGLCGLRDNVTFVLGDSVHNMNVFTGDKKGVGGYVDFLCLDSKEFDPEHAVNEFNAVRDILRPQKHFVLVDDIHNPNSVKYKKVVPLLISLGYSYIEVPTPTGLFLSCVGYGLPNS